MAATTTPQFVLDIIEQMGGAMMFKMAFSRSVYVESKRQITFTVAPALKRATRNYITHVRVTVDPSDTYSVEMLAVRGTDVRVVDETSEIYCDRLQAHVEYQTGLALSFRRPIAVVA